MLQQLNSELEFNKKHKVTTLVFLSDYFSRLGSLTKLLFFLGDKNCQNKVYLNKEQVSALTIAKTVSHIEIEQIDMNPNSSLEELFQGLNAFNKTRANSRIESMYFD